MDRIQRLLFKTMMVLAALAIGLSLISQLLRAASTIHLIVVGATASAVAYVVRERRNKHEKRPRGGSSGERTPVMPRSKS